MTSVQELDDLATVSRTSRALEASPVPCVGAGGKAFGSELANSIRIRQHNAEKATLRVIWVVRF